MNWTGRSTRTVRPGESGWLWRWASNLSLLSAHGLQASLVRLQSSGSRPHVKIGHRIKNSQDNATCSIFFFLAGGCTTRSQYRYVGINPSAAASTTNLLFAVIATMALETSASEAGGRDKERKGKGSLSDHDGFQLVAPLS
eukprot:3807733-Rhodomonas_salina.3